MKYKLIVDKQSRTNPSTDKREYEIDIEELRVKGDVYDSLVITVEETYIIRRLSLSEYQVLSVLNEPIKETLGDLNVQLFEGNNYIYLMDMTGNKFYAEYIVKNEFNELYVTNAQMNSAINQTVSGIELSVNQKLTGYSTVADTANAKQEAIDDANADTDEKLKNYSTTKEMEASINIKIDEVTTKVSRVETQVTTVEEKADKAQETADTLKTQTIQKVDVMYVLSNSSTDPPTSGWQTTAPAWENGKYMWQKTITTYGDGTTKESDATCITGATGATGKAGENGKDGENGNDGEKGDTGIGVKSIEEQYYLSTSNTSQTGGSWKTTQDTWTSEKYIWTRNKIIWTDNTTTYTEAILATGLNNANNTANNAKETADGVSENLKTNYYTKTETSAEIKTKADEITSNVSKTYSTKTETSNAKQEAINSANASTDEKLEDYSTTAEMNTVIKQTAESIGLSVDEKINSAIGTNYIKNGTFENDLENWTRDTSGSTTGSVTVQENSGSKYAQIISKGALTKLSQTIEGLKKDTEHTLIFNAYDNGDLEIDLEDGIFQVDIIQYKESSEEILEETSTRIYVSKESKTYEVKFTPTENIDAELIFSLKNPFVSNYSMSVMLTNIALCNGEVSEKFAKMQIESDIISSEVSKKVGNDEIISKINQSPEAVGIDANKIKLSANDILNLLAGNTINLGSKSITITSDAFNVDRNGNVSIIDKTGTSGRFKIYSEDTDYETDIRSFGQFFQGPNGYVGIEADFTLQGGSIKVSPTQEDWENCTLIQNGSVECVKLTQTSLAERKKNIEKLKDNAIDIIKNIDIYKYNLKSEKDTDKKHIGFVIGDDYKYSEEVTSLDNKGVDNYSFTSLCCKAIQEQQEIIESLQKQIKELKEANNG